MGWPSVLPGAETGIKLRKVQMYGQSLFLQHPSDGLRPRVFCSGFFDVFMLVVNIILRR